MPDRQSDRQTEDHTSPLVARYKLTCQFLVVDTHHTRTSYRQSYFRRTCEQRSRYVRRVTTTVETSGWLLVSRDAFVAFSTRCRSTTARCVSVCRVRRLSKSFHGRRMCCQRYISVTATRLLLFSSVCLSVRPSVPRFSIYLSPNPYSTLSLVVR